MPAHGIAERIFPVPFSSPSRGTRSTIAAPLMNASALRVCAAISVLFIGACFAPAAPTVVTTFTQNQWVFDLRVELIDGPTGPVRRDLLFNELWGAGETEEGDGIFAFSYNLLPVPLPNNWQ